MPKKSRPARPPSSSSESESDDKAKTESEESEESGEESSPAPRRGIPTQRRDPGGQAKPRNTVATRNNGISQRGQPSTRRGHIPAEYPAEEERRPRQSNRKRPPRAISSDDEIKGESVDDDSDPPPQRRRSAAVPLRDNMEEPRRSRPVRGGGEFERRRPTRSGGDFEGQRSARSGEGGRGEFAGRRPTRSRGGFEGRRSVRSGEQGGGGHSARGQEIITQHPAAFQGDDVDEDLRRALDLSINDAGPRTRPEAGSDKDEDLLRAIKASQKAQKEQEKHRARELRRIQQKDDEELELAKKLSMDSTAEDDRKRAARMASQAGASSLSPSWTEGNLNSARNTSAETQTSASVAPAPAKSSKTVSKTPKRGFSQRAKDTIRKLGSSKKAEAPAKKPPRKQQPQLPAIPEDSAVDAAKPPEPQDATQTVTRTSSKKAPERVEKTPEPNAIDASVAILRGPPISPKRLMHMMKKAFPVDDALDEAIANSEETRDVEQVQNVEDEDYDPVMAAEIAAATAASLAVSRKGKAGIEEVGLLDPPPSYSEHAKHKRVNHWRWTSSDFRRERPGVKFPITPEIKRIMQLIAELIAYQEAVRNEPPGKGKGKAKIEAPGASDVLALEAPQNDSESPEDPDTFGSRRVREDLAVPTAPAQGFIERRVPSNRIKEMRNMQNNANSIMTSKLPGSRPRPQRPPAHMSAMRNIPMDQHGAPRPRASDSMSRGTQKALRQNPNYRRSGI